MSGTTTTLVMLPGLDGTGLVFKPILEYLPAAIAPVVVCYPTDRVMSFAEHVDFTRAQLPTETPFVLLAESFSGPIALQLLAEPPDNLIGVIFVATFSRYPKPFLLDVARLLPQKPLRALFATSASIRYFCLGTAPGAAVALFRQALAGVALKVLTNRLQILAELPSPDVAYNGPCLYLQARHDHLVPARAASELQHHLPQLQVAQCPGPHILLLAHPRDHAARITAFIAALTESP